MDHIRNHPKVRILLEKTDDFIEQIGFTEHGQRHAHLVSRISHNILSHLGHSIREQKLAEIAGYLHDVGNAVNRVNHAQTGALLAYELLSEMHFKYEDIVDIVGAIGNHHEDEGKPISNIGAAVIIADKTDVHRSRVRKDANILLDIHDRVNYAVTSSRLDIDAANKLILLKLEIDDEVSSVMEYFEIFMERMVLSRKASDFLGCKFHLYVNEHKIL